MGTTQISKKRKSVAGGVFFAELNEVCVLTRESAEDGEKGRRIRELTSRTDSISLRTASSFTLKAEGQPPPIPVVA
ncbi:hypothetical protein Ddye_031750 [Dipteronia dyeriana]|uniref:Uncharacterized protein n=1 Tax=Dipteronia dyeriana TaxID=168575 RepID=A0AAD9TJG9_9ROSI|nr:hypothetical protein Ddye_031750 [Dipteronia dyeriana]